MQVGYARVSTWDQNSRLGTPAVRLISVMLRPSFIRMMPLK